MYTAKKKYKNYRVGVDVVRFARVSYGVFFFFFARLVGLGQSADPEVTPVLAWLVLFAGRNECSIIRALLCDT